MKIRRALSIAVLGAGIAWAYAPLWRAAASATAGLRADDWLFLPRSSNSGPALLPALVFHGLALAAAVRGSEGWRALVLPSLALVLGLPLPEPIANEIVWNLQRPRPCRRLRVSSLACVPPRAES